MRTGEEIWRAASVLIGQAGEAAPGYASRWAHVLLEAGDIENRSDWLRVMVACKAILSQAPEGPSEPR